MLVSTVATGQKAKTASEHVTWTYGSDGEEDIVNFYVVHDVPPGEDAGRDEADHQHQEGVGDNGDVSGMVVGGDGEEWRQRPRHGSAEKVAIEARINGGRAGGGMEERGGGGGGGRGRL